MAKTKIPKRAKLISDGGLYRYVPLEKLVAKIEFPILRTIKLSDPEVDFSDTLRFILTFALVRVTKTYAEYHQINAVKVDAIHPTKTPHS